MLQPGTVFQGRYVVVRHVGGGGQGLVYEAQDQRLGIRVALKQLLVGDQQQSRALEREAHTLAALRHPALPRVIDHFAEAGGQFLVMEFIDGPNLAELLERHGRAFPPQAVLGLAEQLLSVLAYLHDQQPPVIHRDIKPLNLKLRADGTLVLLDFGLAKGLHGRVTASMTSTGFSLDYAPLEQLRGSADERSDLYAVGATLYHLLTGRPPANALDRAAAPINGDPDPLLPPRQLAPALPEPLSQVLLKLLALRASDRPARASDLGPVLRQIREQLPQQPSPAPPPVAAVPSSAGQQTVRLASQRPLPPHVMQAVVGQAPPLTPLNADQARQLTHFTLDKATALAWAPDGRSLAVATASGVTLYELAQQRERVLLKTPREVTALAFSPDSAVLASGAGDQRVMLWRVADGALLHVLNAHSDLMMSVAFAPDGSILASGAQDKTIRLWRPSDGTLLNKLEYHSDWITSLTFSPDGRTLASASWDTSVLLWQIPFGRPYRQLKEPVGYARSIAFSPNGQILAAGSQENMIYLWRVADGFLMRALEGHAGGITSVAFDPYGGLLASGSWDGTVRLWRTADGVLLRTLVGHRSGVTGVAFNRQGTLLASSSADSTVRLWGLP